MQMPQAGQMPAGSPFGSHTTQVCVTDEMIKRYGGPMSGPTHGDCKVTNVSLKDTGMTATLTCTGQFTGTGAVEAAFVDANTTTTKLHMTGTAQMGNSGGHPIDITVQSKAVYKGADCGSVKPMALPAEAAGAK